METKHMDPSLEATIRGFQQNEANEYLLYRRLARHIKSPTNAEILLRIAEDERRHAEFWKRWTGREVRPNRWKVAIFYAISRILGLTFGIKWMERGEEKAQVLYASVVEAIPEAEAILREEEEHEAELIGLIDEETLHYVGSIVLGLNDALVELTGGLAGLTLALRKGRLIAMSGLIVGIAAALSMAASEYLSQKAEKRGRDPLKSALYTGIAYLVTVTLLVFPYLCFPHPFLALGFMLILAIGIIAGFNYYLSVARGTPFRRPFFEMVLISLGVAVFSFGVGYLIRLFLGVEV